MSRGHSKLVLVLILIGLCSSTSTCSMDVCANGFCSLEVGQPVCSCVLGWTGDSCEIEDDDYIAVECVNGFVRTIGDNFVCSCESGWQGDSCSEAIIDYHPCSDVDCNNQGYCLLDEDSKASCNCDGGYSGDQCQHQDSACSDDYLMNLASAVYDESWNA